MIAGVLSDSHGNLELMLEVAATMTSQQGAELIFHLGDDFADAVFLERNGYPIRKVPGLWCPEYRDTRVPKRLVEQIEGVTVACAHADKDLRAVDRAADVVLTGHTHAPRVELLGRTLYVNPGHVKGLQSRGHGASYAMLTIERGHVRAVVHCMAGGALYDVCLELE